MSDNCCQSGGCNSADSPQNNENFQEFLSRSLDYKATINKLDTDQFEIFIYQWSESETDDHGCPLWEKSAGPYLLAPPKKPKNTLLKTYKFYQEKCLIHQLKTNY